MPSIFTKKDKENITDIAILSQKSMGRYFSKKFKFFPDNRGWMNFFEIKCKSVLCYSLVSSAKQNFPMCFSIDLTLY